MDRAKRQVRYNRRSDPVDEPMPHRWTFMIVNEPREVIRIRNRIYEELQPIDDLVELDAKGIRGSRGLQYQIFCFLSSVSEFEPKRVYGGSMKKDRDLVERSDEELVPYVSAVLEGRR